ncbi:MAG: single-stranded DNA-binding protein [Desulfonatronovibrio sp.]
MNKAMIIGKIRSKSRLLPVGSNTVVLNLVVATNEDYIAADGEKFTRSEFHRVLVFQKQAQLCSYCLELDNRVYVEGRLRTKKWKGKLGEDRYTTEILAVRVIPMEDSVIEKMEKILDNPLSFPMRGVD